MRRRSLGRLERLGSPQIITQRSRILPQTLILMDHGHRLSSHAFALFDEIGNPSQALILLRGSTAPHRLDLR
jgi:hypothetical protein